ncbi:MAG: hypothetical protein AAGC55_01475 [Myxococcota bacterium]
MMGNAIGPVADELSVMLQDFEHLMREAFVEKFGREPTADDPLFFDPDADEPRPMNETAYVIAVATLAYPEDMTEAVLYAIEKTGLLIVPGVNDLYRSEDDKDIWQSALDEFARMN